MNEINSYNVPQKIKQTMKMLFFQLVINHDGANAGTFKSAL
jgi:hypothetical protein